MDEFARRPAEDRRAYIEEAANRRDLTPVIIEKDFWVCWTLRRLVGSAALEGSFTFKGGTSLSKAYGLIHRFSEDIDLTISRTAPLIRDVGSPMENGISGKERQRRTKALKVAAQQYVATIAMPALIQEVETALGTAEGWSVALDPEDADAQTLLFNYPSVEHASLGAHASGAGFGDGSGYGFGSGDGSGHDVIWSSPYIKPRIKLEFGARGDTEPFEMRRITPYLAEEFPDELPDVVCELPTLSVIRTFWEKVTILHALHYNGKLRDGMSRHYYDTLMLARSGVADEALAYPDLLEQVVRNKSLMFADNSASYETAVPGSLRVAPSAEISAKLKQDYAAMSEMFMAAPPSFDDLLAGIAELETKLRGPWP
ncbi:nucleotidyl transferase AbiEii/AbiGii toxin family protein [Sphingomonas hengshuiensis]|uniref:Nucleotidyl transferase AbiEii/AbiGii toxin family protein n=1 Tax=Sphingomonas hengshuiensis TaxID=1609977 RepID=A0A7U4LEP8_9SPHN|nr:nucleotidyl transferase AbiEii/AbiGii toxin family protein [Sphingomonas hengshuiensis]AJP71709.1 hypothetical protein TS85_07805 [Sphingomonas hengshuiensis]